MKRLVDKLFQSRVITNERIAQAMSRVDRGEFCAEGADTYADAP